MKKNICLIIIILIIFSGCKNQKRESEAKEESIPVTVTKSEKKSFVPALNYAGTAKANKEANLGTAIPGRVEKIHFNEGQAVKKGDLIVELSSELYLQALVERNTLEKDFERVSRLQEKESISRQDYDHVKAKYDASKAKTQMMKKNTEIRAPFSGTIVDHMVKEGENFLFSPSLKAGYSMTSGIIKLMQLDVLKVEIDVNEKDLSKIKPQQKAEVIFDAYPERKYEGQVTKIDPVLSTISRSAKAEIRIENNDGLIKPGMYAKVNLILPEQEAVFVPLEAIYRQTGTGNDFVFRIVNDEAKRIPVKRTFHLDDKVGVTGIEPGITIAVSGKNKLIEGSKVEIKK